MKLNYIIRKSRNQNIEDDNSVILFYSGNEIMKPQVAGNAHSSNTGSQILNQYNYFIAQF
jgi:hypothetical protein